MVHSARACCDDGCISQWCSTITTILIVAAEQLFHDVGPGLSRQGEKEKKAMDDLTEYRVLEGWNAAAAEIVRMKARGAEHKVFPSNCLDIRNLYTAASLFPIAVCAPFAISKTRYLTTAQAAHSSSHALAD